MGGRESESARRERRMESARGCVHLTNGRARVHTQQSPVEGGGGGGVVLVWFGCVCVFVLLGFFVVVVCFVFFFFGGGGGLGVGFFALFCFVFFSFLFFLCTHHPPHNTSVAICCAL